MSEAASPLQTPRSIAAGSAGKTRGAAQLHHTGYSYEGLDSADWAEGPWQKPSLDKAIELYQEHLFQGGEAPVIKTSIASLEPLGPGVVLYFVFLRHLSCFFILATVLTLPIVLLSYRGGSLSTVAMAVELDALHVSLLSIANIGLPLDPSADATSLHPFGSFVPVGFTHRGASIAIAAVDFTMVIAFLFFCAVMRMIMASASLQVRTHVAKASDYAVYVTGLPKDATEDEVRNTRGVVTLNC